MRYSVRLKPSADRALSKLARDVQARILGNLEQLAEDPFPAGVEKMQDESGYRVRVGDYRIVYDVLHDELTVLVIRIGHRREIYR
jgi:mRNA interferase RelE/StbE